MYADEKNVETQMEVKHCPVTPRAFQFVLLDFFLCECFALLSL